LEASSTRSSFSTTFSLTGGSNIVGAAARRVANDATTPTVREPLDANGEMENAETGVGNAKATNTINSSSTLPNIGAVVYASVAAAVRLRSL
jgi:hypothetical protein